MRVLLLLRNLTLRGAAGIRLANGITGFRQMSGSPALLQARRGSSSTSCNAHPRSDSSPVS
jgi:hypothetical protein